MKQIDVFLACSKTHIVSSNIITNIIMGELMLRRVWQDIEMNMADICHNIYCPYNF